MGPILPGRIMFVGGRMNGSVREVDGALETVMFTRVGARGGIECDFYTRRAADDGTVFFAEEKISDAVAKLMFLMLL